MHLQIKNLELVNTEIEGSDLTLINKTWLEDGRYQNGYKDLDNKTYAEKRSKEIEAYQKDKETRIDILRDTSTREVIAYAITNKKELIYVWVRKYQRRKKIATLFVEALREEGKLSELRYKFY